MIIPAGQRLALSPARVRAELAEQLAARRDEIEETILARIFAISAPTGEEDAEYVEGLPATLAAAIDYGLTTIAAGEERLGAIPPAILAQARHAVRNRVGLQTVLRRYFAGYTALGDFFMHEAREGELAIDGATLHMAQRELAAVFDRIVAAISAEYERTAALAARRREERLAERVKRLLAGEPIDASELGYELDGWHLGTIATGPAAEQVLREAAARLDRRLLLVPGGERSLWGWFGGRQRMEAEALVDLSRLGWPGGVSIALGEPTEGLAGWRLTHRQARAALRISLRKPQPLIRYADVALLAAIQRDEELREFLVTTFLAPLGGERGDGAAMRDTLRAYFASARNVSSAAAALGVSRQTITSRLGVIEDRLGRQLHTCAAELEAAIRLAVFEQPDSPNY